MKKHLPREKGVTYAESMVALMVIAVLASLLAPLVMRSVGSYKEVTLASHDMTLRLLLWRDLHHTLKRIRIPLFCSSTSLPVENSSHSLSLSYLDGDPFKYLRLIAEDNEVYILEGRGEECLSERQYGPFLESVGCSLWDEAGTPVGVKILWERGEVDVYTFGEIPYVSPKAR